MAFRVHDAHRAYARAIELGARPISRHRDREQLKAVIVRAKAQGNGNAP